MADRTDRLPTEGVVFEGVYWSVFRRSRDIGRGFALAALLIGAAVQFPAAFAQSPPAADSQTQSASQDQATVEIATKSGVHIFSVELAVNDEQRARGLMERKELPEGKGMLFDFQREQEVAFWMKNTLIPLDIIFITGKGRILRIHENAEPLSERSIPSGGPVRGVLEVIGGTSRRLGIAVGDQVGHPIFSGR